MNYSHDNMLLVRKELAELLDALRATAFDASPLQFLLRL